MSKLPAKTIEVDPNHLDVLWAVLLGWGQGSSIGLAFMMMVVRASSRGESMALSGMAQGLGYLIASVGPVLIGGLFDFSHGWSVPLIVLLVLLGFQAILAITRLAIVWSVQCWR